MTLEEKRDYLDNFCYSKDGCEDCIFDHEGMWCHKESVWKLSESEIDKAIAILNDTKEDTTEFKVDKAMEVEKHLNEMVNHPSHYNQGGMECIDEMILIFGKEATMNFCLCNAWKYRYRANAKNGQEDLDKANWYISKYKELKEMV